MTKTQLVDLIENKKSGAYPAILFVYRKTIASTNISAAFFTIKRDLEKKVGREVNLNLYSLIDAKKRKKNKLQKTQQTTIPAKQPTVPVASTQSSENPTKKPTITPASAQIFETPTKQTVVPLASPKATETPEQIKAAKRKAMLDEFGAKDEWEEHKGKSRNKLPDID
jgi:hypothetical protein